MEHPASCMYERAPGRCSWRQTLADAAQDSTPVVQSGAPKSITVEVGIAQLLAPLSKPLCSLKIAPKCDACANFDEEAPHHALLLRMMLCLETSDLQC